MMLTLVLTAAVLASPAVAGRLEQLAYSHASSSAYASASAGASASSNAYSGAVSTPFRYDNRVNNGDGSYSYSYDTNNGISAHESGSPRAGGAVGAEGGFSYRAPDGRTLAVAYTADERGFRPVGAHLPTPPPVPAAILRSLEYN